MTGGVDTDVVVVGAGPVGLALAGDLAEAGVAVEVLEKNTEPNTESRASTVHAATMLEFQDRGLLDGRPVPPNEPMSHFGGLPLNLAELSVPYAGQWKITQPVMEQWLVERAEQFGVRVRRGHEFRAQSPNTTGNRALQVGYVGPDGPGLMAADFLVGCDGENSTVRRAGGFQLAGHGPTRMMLRADIEGIDIPNRRFERHPHGLAIAARRPDGVTRVMVHEFGAPVEKAVSFGSVVQAWSQVTGEDLSSGRPTWLNSFDDRLFQVTEYRRGRVLLAGDAAHQQMPIGGQAVNLGLLDAFDLSCKLAAVITGEASPELLDSYHQERHRAGRTVLTNIDAQAALLLGGPEVEPMRAVLRELLAYQPVRHRLASVISGVCDEVSLQRRSRRPAAGLQTS